MALEPVRPKGKHKASQTDRKNTDRADRKPAARKAQRSEDRRQAGDPEATVWLARRAAERAVADARRVLEHAQRALEQAQRALSSQRRKRG